MKLSRLAVSALYLSFYTDDFHALPELKLLKTICRVCFKYFLAVSASYLKFLLLYVR